MDISTAVNALAALAQESRMKVFRLLVEQGPQGLPATEIAEKIGVRQNLMSTHLRVLAHAGVTKTRRDGRRIYHAVDFDQTRDLFGYLLHDCCNGQPEQCSKLLEEILPIDQCASEESNKASDAKPRH